MEDGASGQAAEEACEPEAAALAPASRKRKSAGKAPPARRPVAKKPAAKKTAAKRTAAKRKRPKLVLIASSSSDSDSSE